MSDKGCVVFLLIVVYKSSLDMVWEIVKGLEAGHDGALKCTK